MTRDEKDKVTVGQIRKVLEGHQQQRVDTLGKLVLQRDKNGAKEELKTILDKIEQLNDLDLMAGIPNLQKIIRGK